MTETPSISKPLSERPMGYALAVLGGFIGAPLGLLTSPGVLYLLNKSMKGKEGKQPNRFARWALIGIIGAPLSMAISHPAFKQGYEQGSSVEQNSSSTGSKESIPNREEPPVTRPNREEPPVTSISAGDFTISNVKIAPYTGDTKGADVAGELWSVHASVTNNSKETSVPGYSMTTEIVDSEGRKFKAADFVVTSNAIIDEAFGGKKVTRFTDGILPGSTRENVQVGVFDVTKGAQGLRLCAGALFSGSKCIN